MPHFRIALTRRYQEGSRSSAPAVDCFGRRHSLCIGMATTKDWEIVPGFDPIEAKFIRLDLDRWLEKHGIAKDARARGAENQPPADAKSLGDQETKIVAWINRRALDCRQKVTGYLSDLMQNLVDIEDDAGLKILVQRAEEIAAKARSDLAQQADEELDDLATPKSDLRVAASEFKEFRESASIRHLADYSHRKRALPVIWVCFAVEVVLNAALLMDVNAFGLIGSIVQMGLISAVNILIGGLAMGALLRQAHHHAASRKTVSWILIAAVVAAVVAFNLAIGHFRDSMQAVLSDPAADILSLGNDALVRYADGPFRLDSFQSALLALLGVLFFALASWKWLHRDDPYPGYGPRARRIAELKEGYVRQHKSAQKRLEATRDRHDSQLTDIRHDLQIRQEKWEGDAPPSYAYQGRVPDQHEAIPARPQSSAREMADGQQGQSFHTCPGVLRPRRTDRPRSAGAFVVRATGGHAAHVRHGHSPRGHHGVAR